MVHPYPSYNSIGMIKEINGYNVDMEFLFKDSTSKDESFRICPLNERVLVSNMARCYDMEKEKFLNDYSNNSTKTPYKTWFLCSYEDDSKTKKNNSYPIHRVVAETWCDKPDTNERLVVDHIDGDKHNNLASNLRWVTYKENSNAQDVQERKAQTLKMSNQHKREIQALTSIIAEKDKMIQSLTETVRQLQCMLQFNKNEKYDDVDDEFYSIFDCFKKREMA